MKRKKLTAIITLATVAFIAAGVFVLTSWVPGAYQPARLSDQMRTAVANSHFPSHLLDFGNATQLNEPFTWTLTDGQLNAYLGSADEIVDFLSPGPHMAGRVDAVLAEAEITGVAGALDDGVLTLMARRVGRNQIISVDVSFDYTADGRLKVSLEQLRIGLLPIPRKLISAQIRQFANSLGQGSAEVGSTDGKRAGSIAGVSADDLARLTGQLVKALDGEPVDPVIKWPVGKKTVRINQTDIDDGKLILHVQPVK